MRPCLWSNRKGAAALLSTLVATQLWAAPAAVAAAPGSTVIEAPRPAAARLQARANAVKTAGAIGVVAATSGPRIRWSGAAGVRSIDTGRRARARDTARVGSVTKTMVATLALQEVQRSQWTLSTTVDDVLPGLLPGHGSLTLEQLLSHRSGLPDYLPPIITGSSTNAEFFRKLSKRYTDRQLVRLALSQPWLFAPGSDFSYSNTNYVVVGMMLSRSNRKPLARLLSQRIFRPARMTSASFPRSAWSHRPRLAEYAILKSARSLRRSSPSLFSAAGAVVANTRDLDRFYRALITGRLLAPGLLRSMVTPRSTKTLKYGLGIYAVGDPCPGPNGQPQVLYGHDGATFGTQTLAFTSADGTRQASIAWTGRQYVAAPPTAKPANDFLVEAFSANCPRPVPAPSPGAGPTRQQRSAGQLPPLQELVPPDLEVHRPAP